MGEQRYCVDYAKLGTAGCKKCKVKIEKGSLRIAKVVSNPFSDEGGDMKQWYHVPCIFETFKRARATTKKIEDPTDLEGWEVVKQEDRGSVLKLIDEFQNQSAGKAGGQPKTGAKKNQTPVKNQVKQTKQSVLTNVTKSPAKKPVAAARTPSPTNDSNGDIVKHTTTTDPNHRDNSFREFRRLCANIAEESGYIAKTNAASAFLSKGTSGSAFEGDLYLWLKMLLPGIVKRVYNVQSKQLVKLFSVIFGTNQDEMITDLEQGDVAETVKTFFEQSQICPPSKKSNLTLFDVDEYLDELSKETKEDDQIRVLKKITKRCTSNDLKMVVRLIKHDLRINAGAKHILEAVHPDAYQAFQASRNLKDVVERIQDQRDAAVASGKPGLTKTLSIRASLMTPVLPMLAEACKSVEYAMKKCPNGMYAEIKYDGERVQLHKQGNKFNYFSRSLKPVLPHKVQHFKDYIPKAFPHGNDVILDSEVLLIDTNTGNPLPFGTLGKHKKEAFKDANVCLFVFDCIHYNGESFIEKPLKERRRILENNMVEIPNRVMFSEMQHITQPSDLQAMIMKVLRQGLEGLVLKDVKSPYEPGKRHWLKVKKDYLAEGAMADSADLMVLGAFYGTGNKGGMMSIFLMGCYDPMLSKWCTVTKVSGGHDDATLDRLQKELEMIKISKDATKVPNWLNVNKNLIPDFVAKDPKKSQVWEIVGAEFTKAEIHTAAGISIRFPRVTKIRYDKNWETATSLPELKELFKKSKESSDLPDLLDDNSISPVKGQANGSKRNSDTEDDEDVSMTSLPTTPKKNTSRNSSRSSTPRTSAQKRPAAAATSDDDVSPTKKVKQLDISSFFQSSKVKDRLQQPPLTPPDNSSPSLIISVSPITMSKPECRYGSSCYQKNPDHLKKFDHSTSPLKTLSSAPTTNPLPDLFRGVRVFLPKDLDKCDVLRRYVVAYDGDVVDDFELAKATHIVVTKSSSKTKNSSSTSSVCVTEDWLWDCIKLQKLVPCRPYAPSSSSS